jgi:16S rRNA C967 or C1407 C5-methylase (RsmB/RsmF family)
VTNTAGLFQSQSFADGEFYVQDPSTLVAVEMLDPQPGDSVLDMCAAPGGKTTYLAQKMQNRGRIIAADSTNSRLALVGENCRRLGVDIVATLACEGTRLDRCLRGDEFDRVLVDAPCSNTGVLRRRVDLRWRLEETEIIRLAGLQTRLLAAAAKVCEAAWRAGVQHVQPGTGRERTRRRNLSGGPSALCSRSDTFAVSATRRSGWRVRRQISKNKRRVRLDATSRGVE